MENKTPNLDINLKLGEKEFKTTVGELNRQASQQSTAEVDEQNRLK